jgi:hypothetical protein
MDIVNKRRVTGGNGNAASDMSEDVLSRACSWQYGADASCEAIEAESAEEDKAFGTPNSSREHIRGNPSGMEKLDNPHNFSSNPGFMSTSGMLGAAAPANGDGVIRGTSARGSLPLGGRGPARPFSPASSRG